MSKSFCREPLNLFREADNVICVRPCHGGCPVQAQVHQLQIHVSVPCGIRVARMVHPAHDPFPRANKYSLNIVGHMIYDDVASTDTLGGG